MKKLFAILTLAASIFATSNVSAATIESDNTQHTISLSIVQDNPSRELLETAVKEMQKMLPMDLGMGLTMSDAYVTSSNFALEIEASSELVDVLREGFKTVEKSDILAGVTLESLVVARRVAKAVYRKAELGEVSLADFPMMCHSKDVLDNGKDAELPWESFTYDHTK